MSNEHSKELQKEYSKIIAKTWCDPEFKKEFFENPIPILNKHGFNIPNDAEVYINTGETPSGGLYHFNVPPAPAGLDCPVPEVLNCNGPVSCCCCCCC
ncbi:hypothetical protein [Bacillus thuringiensis]|uniref:NHLP leader peptide family natural product n=1 Tax=Bacillus thuringiensis TaxID=1428 RepID=A0AAW4HXY7_BACTU|nr:hypothetical protein [Bacillus thuringiensis]MBN9901097.1 hypothetical protein [Bacillus thuringiensis]MDY7522185.1 hypothetical protein [Bacillus thuringiensis]